MPILDLTLLWHPGDPRAGDLAADLLTHLRGSPQSGLRTGAMEIFFRSAGWTGAGAAPRPLFWPGQPGAAAFAVVVPLLGDALADALAAPGGPWAAYAAALQAEQRKDPTHRAILPYRLDEDAASALPALAGGAQALAPLPRLTLPARREEAAGMLRRDLVQALAQFLEGRRKITGWPSARWPGRCWWPAAAWPMAGIWTRTASPVGPVKPLRSRGGSGRIFRDGRRDFVHP